MWLKKHYKGTSKAFILNKYKVFIQNKNIQPLLIDIYKNLNELSPPII